MKTALYYSLRKGWNAGLGYRPVAITSERGGRWFGRDLEHNFSTNGAIRDLTGRFETEEDAKRKIQGLRDIAAIFQPHIDDLDRQRKKVVRDWGKAEREFITGVIEG